MAGFLITVAFCGVTLIRRRTLLEGRAYSYLSINVHCLLEGGAYLRSGTYQRKYGIYKAKNWFLPAITIQIIQLFLSHSLTLGLSLSNETEAKMQRGSWRTTKEKKLLPQTSTNSNSHGSSERVQESGKLKILAF